MITLSEFLETPSMGEVIKERRERERRIEAKRRYEGARVNRLESGWTTNPTGGNYEMRLGLRALRARARDVARNNSHFKKFLSMCRSNIIGPKGIQLQSRARLADGSLNTELNKRVEEAFWEWCFKENCTASGKLSFFDAQNLFVTHLARDGEVLVQKLTGADNPFGFALKFIDVSYLDENYNEELKSGNRVIMSIEVDRNDKPVAYYLTTPASEYMFKGYERLMRVRVPASEIIHAFLTYDDETQTRGVTWFHSALIDARHLHGYKHGVITSARAAASSFGMLMEEDSGEQQFDGEEDDEGRPKNIEMDVAPLSMNIIPKGYRFEQFDPKQPTQNHPAFYKSILMDLAVGLDVFYFNLSGDMEAVNYSSARVGLNEERDIWRGMQEFVIAHFCREIFHEWARSAWLAKKLKLTAKEFVEIKNPMWRARGWAFIDPLKEVVAKVIGLDNMLTNWTDELGEQGRDFAEHLETVKSEHEQAAKMGVELQTAAGAASKNKEDAPEEKSERNLRYLEKEFFRRIMSKQKFGFDTEELIDALKEE
jgi:lambda family phage portal protein